MQRKIIVGLILLILSVNCLASFSVGFRVVLSGGVLPTLVLRYEHQSGHGVELSAGAMFNLELSLSFGENWATPIDTTTFL